MADEEESNITDREDLLINVMTRKRYSWDIDCERDEATSSQTFYSAVYQLRYYFYGVEDWKKFATRSEDH